VQKINGMGLSIANYGRSKPLRAKQGATSGYIYLDGNREVSRSSLAGRPLAPEPIPPFLRHIPAFRRMAIPIKDTPVLTGKDARDFDKWLKSNEVKKITPDEYRRIQDAAKKFSFDVQDGVLCGECYEPSN
jgi:hypothetical protein